jgi:hypothetical protein
VGSQDGSYSITSSGEANRRWAAASSTWCAHSGNASTLSVTVLSATITSVRSKMSLSGVDAADGTLNELAEAVEGGAIAAHQQSTPSPA